MAPDQTAPNRSVLHVCMQVKIDCSSEKLHQWAFFWLADLKSLYLSIVDTSYSSFKDA